jgi:hypothetical protein
MSDNQAGDTAPAVTPSDTARKRRGRPAGNKPDRKPETPQQRIDRLKTELRAAEQAKREIEAKQDSIVGTAIVTHALANADYRKQLAVVLRKEVTGKSDLAAISDLLA